MLLLLQRLSVIAMTALITLSGVAAFRVAAQDAPIANLQSEVDIGFNCPVSSTLNPGQTQLWILFDNCGGGHYTVLIYDLASGAFVKVRDDDFAPFFESLTYEQWVSSFTSPFAYTPDETLELIYADSTQDYDTGHVIAPVTNDEQPESSTVLLTLEILESLIPGYAGYPESTIYNADHTIAAVSDLASIHVFNLQNSEELFVIDTPDGSERYFPVFGSDGQSLYVPYLLNYEDMNDYSASVNIYNLADGALTATYEVPTPFFWPSPDNQWIAGIIPDPAGEDSADNLLLVVDLNTGSVSQTLPINEPARRATQCMNDGRSLTDFDITLDGNLPITSLIWLPDSSGFYTTNSYGGDALGGGRLCILDYSRLRFYTVEASN